MKCEHCRGIGTVEAEYGIPTSAGGGIPVEECAWCCGFGVQEFECSWCKIACESDSRIETIHPIEKYACRAEDTQLPICQDCIASAA